jgi:hypothetical protein
VMTPAKLAGIVVGSFVLLCLLIMLCTRKNRQRKRAVGNMRKDDEHVVDHFVEGFDSGDDASEGERKRSGGYITITSR